MFRKLGKALGIIGIKDIKDIIESNPNKNLTNIMLNLEDSFSINGIVIKKERVLGKGQFKTGLKVKVKSGLPGVQYAAFVYTNANEVLDELSSIIKGYELADDSGITPKLYTYYEYPNKGVCFLFELIEGDNLCDVCDKQAFDIDKQLMLLDAYLRLGKIGEYGLHQDDENCGNIIFNENGVRIIDDIKKTPYRLVPWKLFYILYCIFTLQKIQDSELYHFIGNWLSEYKNYDKDSLFNENEISLPLPTSTNDHLFQSKIHEWLGPITLKKKGGKRKTNRNNQKKLKKRKTKRRY
jgi:predicted Ser/Thr protein kinase